MAKRVRGAFKRPSSKGSGPLSRSARKSSRGSPAKRGGIRK